jgi:hypothetical protein
MLAMSGLKGLGARLRTWSLPEVGSREGEVTHQTACHAKQSSFGFLGSVNPITLL